jgi:hypothetical protein
VTVRRQLVPTRPNGSTKSLCSAPPQGDAGDSAAIGTRQLAFRRTLRFRSDQDQHQIRLAANDFVRSNPSVQRVARSSIFSIITFFRGSQRTRSPPVPPFFSTRGWQITRCQTPFPAEHGGRIRQPNQVGCLLEIYHPVRGPRFQTARRQLSTRRKSLTEIPTSWVLNRTVQLP